VPRVAFVASGLPKPYVETHAVGYAWIVIAVVTGVLELSGALRSRSEATARDRGSQLVIRLCAVPGVILLILSPRIAPGAAIQAPLIASIVGLVVFASGEALRIWSRLTLGRYFTYSVMTSSDQPVITNGPYRLVRHPSYTGVLLIVLGIGTVYGNWLGLGCFALTYLAGLLYRIHVEERALFEDLGDRYKAFAAGRKRLIPHVW
jgi:protein-S-isoprenylcysteine O-methyltransferase Ste14